MYLLSVIIPIYNAEAWLEKCISSLLSSISSDFSSVELILVNDGSTDCSGLICDRYADGHSNFRVIHKPNGGVSSARNAGISAATGTYFAWVDPDDYVAPEWFSAIRDVIHQYEPDIILTDSIKFGLGAQQPEVYGRQGGFVDFDTFYTDVLRDIRIRSGLPNKIMKARLFQGVSFDTELTILEDFAAIPHILQSANTVYYIPKCLYYYRQHKSSLLHHSSAQLAFNSVEIAVRRLEATPKEYQAAAITAAVWQAFTFLRTDALTAKPFAPNQQYRFCCTFIRRHILTLLREKELSILIKCKIFLSTLHIYPILLQFFTKKH